VGHLNTKCPVRRVRTIGFTLVELLVVLVVLGIAASLAVANLGSDERRDIQREAKRLAGALEHAAALAQWTSETLGVSAEGSGYRFWRRDTDDHWTPFAADEVLAARALPAGLTVAPTSYAGAPVPPDAIVPFRASGRNEPYSLTLSSPAGNIVVSADPLNRVDFAPMTSAPVPAN
jgi:general secretion pathway protein H